MSIQHHISDGLLMDYASGGLEEGWSIAVATHMALCPSCRKRLADMESTGGALLEAIECKASNELDNQSWAALESRIGGLPTQTEKQAATGPLNKRPGLVPEPLRSYIGSLDTLKWRALGLGAYHFPIPTGDKDISVRLLRIPAGKPVPEHSHGGRELTLVLKGSFQDGTDRFGPGDFEETDETVNHQPVAEPDEDCICLAVTDAPLKFRSRVVRLIQPLLGI